MDNRPDWSFARRPFWLFSHLFALSMVVLFVALGLWQLDRHRERAAFNEVVAERSGPPPLTLDDALDLPVDEVPYRLVEATGTYLDDDLVRVVNRSQGGAAGEHVVGLVALTDGRLLLVNRGFVPLGAGDPDRPGGEGVTLRPAPTGPVTVRGWLQASVARGWLGATDTRTGPLAPRFDIEAIAARIGPAPAAATGPSAGGDGDGTVVDHWLLLESDAVGDVGAGSPASAAGRGPTEAGSFPDPVPLPPLDGGPHLSYMGQWFIFATLGVGFYLALLRRASRGGTARQRVEDDVPVG